MIRNVGLTQIVMNICSSVIMIIIISVSDSARILAVFPSTSNTHQKVFQLLMLELSKNHDVTVLTTNAFTKPLIENLTQIDIHDVSYNFYAKFFSFNEGKTNTAFEMSSYMFEEQLLSNEIQTLIKTKKTFDLLFIEMCVRPALVFSHIFKASVILISSFGGLIDNFDRIGAATHYFLYPSPIRRRIINLTMWEKLKELYVNYKSNIYNRELEIWEDDMLKRILGPDVPSLQELKKNVDLLFLNTYRVWDGNRPVPPNVVYLGGLHLKPKQEIPKVLELRLNSSVGAIYMSFGTNVNSSMLPAEKIMVFVRIFSKLPYTILWKWNNEKLPGLSRNIIASKWFPQSDLLHHPKVKVFITQGGLQSTEEAIDAGVPLLGIPLIGDQWFNTEKYEHFKIGIKMDFETITEEGLEQAIDTLINDESYKRNIMKLREIVSDQAQTSLRRAVWWTEYVLRHGGARHYKCSVLSWSEYYEVKLALIVTFIIILLSAIVLLIFSKCRCHCNA